MSKQIAPAQPFSFSTRRSTQIFRPGANSRRALWIFTGAVIDRLNSNDVLRQATEEYGCGEPTEDRSER
jgi:hypothetical protein